MAVRIGGGEKKRDWSKFATATVEAIVQIKALGMTGASNAVSALFRAIDNLRGEDNLELRATTLVFETLCYATYTTIADIELRRNLTRGETEKILSDLISRLEILCTQEEVVFTSEHFRHPATFELFVDARKQLSHMLKSLDVIKAKFEISSIFDNAINKGFSRIRFRKHDYFAAVASALHESKIDSEERAAVWDKYRSNLISYFENAPLFAEDPYDGATLSQVYQPLRAWWVEDQDLEMFSTEDQNDGSIGGERRKHNAHLDMLEDLILNWLLANDAKDAVRFVSGGPGSGKSTFAKRLASLLSADPSWRVIFVPLQRLRGTGSLQSKIELYFRSQRDEPFGTEVSPLADIGRDGHQNWIIIFDGLDELAKEGIGSESAAQDFATQLGDFRNSIGRSASVRYVVLGRAPSMQEARRRLSLNGQGTLHVADMRPLDEKFLSNTNHELKFVDPRNLMKVDQRPEYWERWATAKGLSTTPPEALTAPELDDLTKEPLLAFLLIVSGFATSNWQLAADNRNRIYEAIFDKIWDRESTKETRAHLVDIGKEGFDALMQSLGLAAWRGGGRTGDEATFAEMRDVFVRPDLLMKAIQQKAAGLDNVALLFYTQKDENGGRGYEFLHKSFGEYLTAKALFSALLRWGTQVADCQSDFTREQFLLRWLKLAGPSPMTREIQAFIVNETRLEASKRNSKRPWKVAREWVEILEDIVNCCLMNGLPAQELKSTWREAERHQRNAEESLLVLLNACALLAFPIDIKNRDALSGGWDSGPVKIPAVKNNRKLFDDFFRRTETGPKRAWLNHKSLSWTFGSDSISKSLLSRFDLSGASFEGRDMSRADLQGTNLEGAHLFGVTLTEADLQHSNLCKVSISCCDLIRTNLEYANCTNARIEFVNLEDTIANNANFQNARLIGDEWKSVQTKGANFTGTTKEKKRSSAQAKVGKVKA